MSENFEATKIAFVGTSSVGKTTLIDFYKDRFSDNSLVAFVPEVARKYFSQHPSMPIAERFAESVQNRVQDLALKSERQAHESGATLIFCDRSVLDAPAYVRSTGDRIGSNRLIRKVQDWIPTYTKLFLLDPEGIPFTNDSVRQENLETRQRFHDAFIEMFVSENISFHLLGGAMQERIQKVNQEIKREGVVYER